MANHVTVKAFLQYPEGLELGTSPDVRRFQIDKGTDARGDMYKRLEDTLTTTAFPDIQGLEYSLHYKDDDDDLVQINKMEDLQAAIDGMSEGDKVLRLYVLVETDLTGGAEASSSSDEEVPKRVRFSNAGKRWRRKLRRRRKRALSDLIVTKEYRKAVRLIVKLMHKRQKQPGTPVVEPTDEQEKATLAAISPEVVTFVRKIVDDWHTKLSKKRPRVVAKRVRKQNRSSKPVDKDHFRWLCRFMARWHRRHAGKCEAMAGWSSGETGDDTSGDEEDLVRLVRKRRQTRKLAELGQDRQLKAAPSNASDSEGADADDDVDESSDDKVPHDFRKEVRFLMRQMHGKSKDKPAEEDEEELPAPPPVLSPEVKAFVQQLADDWHARLAQKRPRYVAKTIWREKRKSLPAGLEKDAFDWMCRFFARWHHRHAEMCQAMAGWSSALDTGDESEDKKKKKKDKKKKEKKEKKDKKDKDEKKKDKDEKKKDKDEKKKDKKKEKKDSSSSSSDSEGEEAEKKEDPVSKEFRKDVRTLVVSLHQKKKKAAKEDKPAADQEQAVPTSLTPEVQSFIKQLLDDWHTSLSQKPPRVVAKTMMKKEDTVPASLDADHFRFLCRFMSRWHRKHAGRCDVMSGWSSGETADETSAEEGLARKRRAVRRAKAMEDTFSQSEDTDCQEKACKPVSSEFRTDVRISINQLHKKKSAKPAKEDSKEKKAPTTISPEVQSFLAEFSEEWHTRLANSGKRPRGVSNEMKEGELSLPPGMEQEQYNWLCCYMARWHRKHAAKCDGMSALLS